MRMGESSRILAAVYRMYTPGNRRKSLLYRAFSRFLCQFVDKNVHRGASGVLTERPGGRDEMGGEAALLGPLGVIPLGRAADATRSNSEDHDSFAGVVLADRLERLTTR